MNKFTRSLALLSLLAFSIGAMAQINTTAQGSDVSSLAGNYFARNYEDGFAQTYIVIGNTATGSQTVTLNSGQIVLKDGRHIVPYAVGVPLIIADANQEVVTITAVSGCNITGQITDQFNSQGAGPTCQITATFANLHGAYAPVRSGDNGYLEAVNDAKNNGGGMVYWLFDTGPLTLATGGATTTYAQSSTQGGAPSNFFPTGAFVDGVIGRVTTTITGCSGGWEIGDGTTAARWTVANTTLTAGTTSVNTGAAWTTGINVAATGDVMSANASMVLTCVTSNATAGAVKVRAWGRTPVASAF